ncbi:MAG TPA: PEGA domain-containing protein [Polyangiaceae bacterium]|nr:PEGA domain-containing protein [Polyangiaceae bacterium]
MRWRPRESMMQQTHAPAEQSPVVGDMIGHYHIVGVVGEGSLGGLFVAEQREIHGVSRTVALRCIREEFARDPDFRARLVDFANFAPRLEHPNLVTVHELGEAGTNSFIAMEYLPGESLEQILARCSTSVLMPVDVAVYVVKQVAHALQYLHDRRAAAALPSGFSAREIDPADLFVTYHGTVKWLALGLNPAWPAAVSGEHRVDAKHARVGVTGEDLMAGPAAVLALGTLLWTCVTGYSAQQGASPARSLPEPLEAILMRALAADPAQRFQSVRALSEALDGYLLGRESRPTPKHVRSWLEQTFAPERAALQLQIARGHDVVNALALLDACGQLGGSAQAAQARASLRPRELWATSHSVFSRLERSSIVPNRPSDLGPGSLPRDSLPVSGVVGRRSAVSEPGSLALAPVLGTALPAGKAGPRHWMVVAAVAVCALSAGATAVIVSSDAGSPLQEGALRTAAQPGGGIDVRSTPAGAAVFIDGAPTGLRTPLVLRGLAGGRALTVRVEKAGFIGQQREIRPVSGSIETALFELVASEGIVQLAGAPPDARVYVDDVLLRREAGKPLALPVGPHLIRVETPSSLVFSGTVTIVAGEQTLRVDGAATSP